MLHFETFCYLDNQKTGSTFIRGVLKRYSIERVTEDKKHGRLSTVDRDSVFYFSTCRNPIDQYVSLYEYGCEGKGGLFKRMKSFSPNRIGLYDGTTLGFEQWVEFLLLDNSEESANAIGKRFSNEIIGLNGSRYLFLNLEGYSRSALRGKTKSEIIDMYNEKKIPRYLIKTESLNRDFAYVMRKHLRGRIKEYDVVSKNLERNTFPKSNTSDRVGKVRRGRISSEISFMIAEKEWFHFDVLGYSLDD